MKPESRPRCPVCFGKGSVPAPWDHAEWLDCPHCHGPGFDPYWMGPDQSQGKAHDGD